MISLCIQRFYFVNKAKHRPTPPPHPIARPHTPHTKRGIRQIIGGGGGGGRSTHTHTLKFSQKPMCRKKLLTLSLRYVIMRLRRGEIAIAKGAAANINLFSSIAISGDP